MMAMHFPGTTYGYKSDYSTEDMSDGDLLGHLVIVLGLASAPVWLPPVAAGGVALLAANPKLTADVLLALVKKVLLGTSIYAAVAEVGLKEAEGPLVKWLQDLLGKRK